MTWPPMSKRKPSGVTSVHARPPASAAWRERERGQAGGPGEQRRLVLCGLLMPQVPCSCCQFGSRGGGTGRA